MINWVEFNVLFQHFDKKTIYEVIDLLIDSHVESMAKIDKCIKERDFKGINTTAHYFKSSVGNFYDPITTELTKKLMEMGDKNIEEGLEETFAKLPPAVELLIQELSEYKKKIK
ncbi:MAG: Hpt domain-containing protein [Bacteroidales bacterium]